MFVGCVSEPFPSAYEAPSEAGAQPPQVAKPPVSHGASKQTIGTATPTISPIVSNPSPLPHLNDSKATNESELEVVTTRGIREGKEYRVVAELRNNAPYTLERAVAVAYFQFQDGTNDTRSNWIVIDYLKPNESATFGTAYHDPYSEVVSFSIKGKGIRHDGAIPGTLEIQSHAVSNNSRSEPIVIVKAKNLAGRELTAPIIVAAFYDATGQILDRTTSFGPTFQMKTREEGEFHIRIPVDTTESFETYRLWSFTRVSEFYS